MDKTFVSRGPRKTLQGIFRLLGLSNSPAWIMNASISCFTDEAESECNIWNLLNNNAEDTIVTKTSEDGNLNDFFKAKRRRRIVRLLCWSGKREIMHYLVHSWASITWMVSNFLARIIFFCWKVQIIICVGVTHQLAQEYSHVHT